MADLLADVMLAVAEPDYREPDARPGRERFFMRIPSAGWLRVVTEFIGERDRVVPAFTQSNDPHPRERGR